MESKNPATKYKPLIYRFFQRLTQKKIFLVIFVFFVVSSLFLPSFVHAQSWLSPLTWATWIGGMFLYLLQLAAQGFFALAVALLNFATSDPFKLSYTDPSRNPIIQIGWSLMRDIVNMFFILGLVYIGLATALRLSGFETKKVFVRFLIVALFVNFTPLICGVIVDACNILMKFFLNGYGGFDGLSAIFNYAPTLGTVATHPNLGIITQETIFIALGFVGGFIIFLVALLLLVRYIAIWVLTILSPIAFFAWIFPKGQTWFEKWWSQFLNWSIIGIPAAFFLYLSYQAIQRSNEIFSGVSMMTFSSSEIQKTAGPTLGAAIPSLAGIIMLVIGLFASFQTSATGAGGIIAFAKGKGKMALKWSGKGAGYVGKRAGIGAGMGALGVVGSVGTGWKEAEKAGAQTGARKLLGGVKAGLKALSPTKKGREQRDEGAKAVTGLLERAHLVRPGFYESLKKKTAPKIKKERREALESMITPRLIEAIKRKAFTPGAKRERAEMIRILAERGKFLFKDENGRIDKEKEKRLIEEARHFNVDLSALSKTRVDLVPEINKEAFKAKLDQALKHYQEQHPGIKIAPEVQEGIEQRVRGSMIREAVRKIKPKAFTENVQPEAITEDTVIGMTKGQVEHIGTYGSGEQIAAVEKMINRLLKRKEMLKKKGKQRDENEEAEWQELNSERFKNMVAAVFRSPNYSISPPKTKTGFRLKDIID